MKPKVYKVLVDGSSLRNLRNICLLVFISLATQSIFGQEKRPSIGKITYKAAAISLAGAARVVGPLVAASGKAVLLVFTEPEGAQVTINELPKGPSNKDGVYREEVPLNKQYKIVVNAEKYLPYEESVTIASSQPQFVRARLTPTFGGLHLYNVPKDATLYLDGKKQDYRFKENTDEVILAEVPVGEHKVKIEHPSYVEWEYSVPVPPGLEIGVTTELVAAAQVVVSSLPAVEVLIDNVNQGTTDSTGSLAVPTPVEPGEHRFTFSKPGFVTLSKPINLKIGKNDVPQPELEPNPSYSEFADFFKDGMGLWGAPSAWQWAQKQEAVAIQGPAPGFVLNRSFRDFDVNFNVKFTNGAGAAWVLRAKNPRNYYLFQLLVKERILKTFVVEDGKSTLLQTSNVVVDPSANTSYRIKAEVQADRIKHYLKNNAVDDEETIGIVTDGRFRYGAVGLTTLAGEQFLVEDFFVKPYAPESASR